MPLCLSFGLPLCSCPRWTLFQSLMSKFLTLRSKACLSSRGWTSVTSLIISSDLIWSAVEQGFLKWIVIWKRVEEYLRLFETYDGNWFFLFLVRRLRNLVLFWGQMRLRMKLIAMKELNFVFQMAEFSGVNSCRVMIFWIFLDASSHLCNRLCPSVGRLVGWLVGR